MASLANIHPGDIVYADVRGRRFHAKVQLKEGRALRVSPIEPNISYFSVTGRNVLEHYRKTKNVPKRST